MVTEFDPESLEFRPRLFGIRIRMCRDESLRLAEWGSTHLIDEMDIATSARDGLGDLRGSLALEVTTGLDRKEAPHATALCL
jgi:hypothetical protein